MSEPVVSPIANPDIVTAVNRIPPTMIARHRQSDVSLSFSTDSWRARLLKTVQKRGIAWPDGEGSDPDVDSHVSTRRVLAASFVAFGVILLQASRAV